MERRASLPGADELFRQTGPRPHPPHPGEDTDRTVDQLSLAQLTEVAAVEDSVLSAARGRAGMEVAVPSPPVGALLAWVAASLGAKHVVEIGGAAGVSGLWLLRGMADKGTLTTIEPDPHAQSLAAHAFEEAGVTSRVRSILGVPHEVLPRLSDGAYDLLVVQRIGQDHDRLREHARRLLRPGGVLVALEIAAGSPPEVRQKRSFVQALADDDRITPSVLPLDGGVALATIGHAES